MSRSLCEVVLSRLQVSGLLDQLKAAATDAKAPAAREGAFVAYAALAGGAPRLAEPYLVPMLPTILDKCSDKVCEQFLPDVISSRFALIVLNGDLVVIRLAPSCCASLLLAQCVVMVADYTSACSGRGSWKGIDAEHQRVCYHGGAADAARWDGAEEAVAD